jgi:chitinase
VNHWIKSGFPARKIVLGLPIYGRSFTLKDPKQNGIGAPTRDGGIAGKWTRAKGFLGYYEVIKFT